MLLQLPTAAEAALPRPRLTGMEANPCAWWHCRWLRWHRGCPPARDTPGGWGEAVQSRSPAEPRTRGSRGVTCPARSVPRLFGVPRLQGGEAFPGCAGAEGSSEPWEGSPQHPGDVRSRTGTFFFPLSYFHPGIPPGNLTQPSQRTARVTWLLCPPKGEIPAPQGEKRDSCFPLPQGWNHPHNTRIQALDNSLPEAAEGRQAAASIAPVLPGQEQARMN